MNALKTIGRNAVLFAIGGTIYYMIKLICLPFTVAWYILSLLAIVLDDHLRYWIFGEEKPRYKWR